MRWAQGTPRRGLAARLVLAGATVFGGALLAGTPAGAFGQEPVPLQAGSRVRFQLAEPERMWLQGNLLDRWDDSLSVVVGAGTDTLTLANASVARLEVSRGRRSQAGRGLAIGAGIGAGVGLILSAAAAAEDCRGFGCYEVGPGDVIAVTAFLAAAGAGVGGLIGAVSRREHWAQAPLPRVEARVRPASRGVKVAISVPF